MSSVSSNSDIVSSFDIFVKRLTSISPEVIICENNEEVKATSEIDKKFKFVKKSYNNNNYSDVILSKQTDYELSLMASSVLENYKEHISLCKYASETFLSTKKRWNADPRNPSNKLELKSDSIKAELNLLISTLATLISRSQIGIVVAELEHKQITPVTCQLYKSLPLYNNYKCMSDEKLYMLFIVNNSEIRYSAMYLRIFSEILDVFNENNSDNMPVSSNMNCKKSTVLNVIKSIFKTKLSHIIKSLAKIAVRAPEIHKYISDTCDFNYDDIPDVLDIYSIDTSEKQDMRVFKENIPFAEDIQKEINTLTELLVNTHSKIMPSDLKLAKPEDIQEIVGELMNVLVKQIQLPSGLLATTTTNTNENDNLILGEIKNYFENVMEHTTKCSNERDLAAEYPDDEKMFDSTFNLKLSLNTALIDINYAHSILQAFMGSVFLKNCCKNAITRPPLVTVYCGILEDRHYEWIQRHLKNDGYQWILNLFDVTQLSKLMFRINNNLLNYTVETNDTSKIISFAEKFKSIEKINPDISKKIQNFFTKEYYSEYSEAKELLKIAKLNKKIDKQAARESRENDLAKQQQVSASAIPAPSAEETRIRNEKLLQEDLKEQLMLKEEFELKHRLSIYCNHSNCHSSQDTPRFIDTEAFTMVQCTKDCITRYHDNCFKTHLKTLYKLDAPQLKKVHQGDLACIYEKCTGTINRITHMNNHDEVHRRMLDLTTIVDVNNINNSSVEIDYDIDVNTEITAVNESNSESEEEYEVEPVKAVILKDISELRQLLRENNSNNNNSSSSSSAAPKNIMPGHTKQKKKALHLDEFCSLAAVKDKDNKKVSRPKKLLKLQDLIVTDIPSQYVVLSSGLEGVNEQDIIRKLIPLGVKAYDVSRYANLNMATIFEFKNTITALVAIAQIKDVPFRYIAPLPSNVTLSHIMHRG